MIESLVSSSFMTPLMFLDSAGNWSRKVKVTPSIMTRKGRRSLKSLLSGKAKMGVVKK